MLTVIAIVLITFKLWKTKENRYLKEKISNIFIYTMVIIKCYNAQCYNIRFQHNK